MRSNALRRSLDVLKKTLTRRPQLRFLLAVGLALLPLLAFLSAATLHAARPPTAPPLPAPGSTATESIAALRGRLPPSVWTRAGRNGDPRVVDKVRAALSAEEKQAAWRVCGKALYSSILKAVQVGDMGEQTFVATGDIDDMWTRDSAVQIGLYVGRMRGQPFLRLIVEGAIRRQAFNIIQDPYANAYERKWRDPASLDLRDRVIGRGGWVATRNYELDSGAYFFTQLYDYYLAPDIYRPEKLLEEPMVFDAVNLMVDTWIVEQNHDAQSPYRYFELPNVGKGTPTAYTGMTWSGFRPSDDPCTYGYLIPANIFAAAALERILELNARVWRSEDLAARAGKLLSDIARGIHQYGVTTTRDGTRVYAYEVDGRGGVLADFDDANVPSLLSIPLLGWSGYDRQVYAATRKRILSKDTNRFYFAGAKLRGVGSPHTPVGNVWPMALAIEALTSEGDAQAYAFQLRQSLASSCENDAMHESVSASTGCPSHTRDWFEWANALFVVLVETALGERCDQVGQAAILNSSMSAAANASGQHFYTNRHRNDPQASRGFYQGLEARVKHYE